MSKVILITGASSGIGKVTAELLAKKGHKVYAAARRVELMEELKSLGVSVLKMDVTDDASMQSGVNEIVEKEGRIDVLVNNAGYGSFGPLEETPLAEAKAQFEVNVFGLARLTQLVLPYMRAKKSGRIINISSMAGKFGEPHGSWYHATKYAVEGLSDCLRLELKQFNIQVVLVEPGAIKTEWFGRAEEKMLTTKESSPYKTFADKHLAVVQKAGRDGSDPIVVARAIGKAIEATHPKTRYAVGKGAKSVMFLRALLPDKVFDAAALFLIDKNYI